MTAPFDMVTGAFGQTGHAIARRLQAGGRAVRSLTRAPAPAGSPIRALAPTWDDPTALTEALRGCEVLYSTYWARFGLAGHYAPLVERLATLFSCAREAGVRHIVQLTVAKAQEGRGIPYYDGKARLEAVLASCGVASTVVRPAMMFGPDDTLVNNCAWMLRHLGAFPVLAGGPHRIRPAFVEDVAALCVARGLSAGAARGDRGTESQRLDAVGPETLEFGRLVGVIRDAVAPRAVTPRLPAPTVWLGAKVTAPLVQDTVVTWPELQTIRRGLYDVPGPTNCPTAFTAWVQAHGRSLGEAYHSQRRRAAGTSYPNA